MPDANELELYCGVLEQIRVRGTIAGEFLDQRATYPRLEMAALQMRTMLELVPLGALVSHREDVAAVATAFHRKGADEAAKVVRRVNPDYWPKPVRQGTDT